MNQPTPINPHAQQDSQDGHDQHDHLDNRHCQSAVEHLQHLVHQETDNGRTIIRSIVSIMTGDDLDSTPHHRLQAARLLLKLGFQEAEALINSLSSKMERQAKKEDTQGENGPAQAVSPEHERLNKKLVARIRVETGEGASIVRILNEVLEGRDRDAKPRDRIEAAKVLLSWGFGNPSTPDPEFMSYYSPCHPDCICACRDLDEDHPAVVESHAPVSEAHMKEVAEAERIEEKAAESARQISQGHTDYLSEISHLPGNKKPRRPERHPPFR